MCGRCFSQRSTAFRHVLGSYYDYCNSVTGQQVKRRRNRETERPEHVEGRRHHSSPVRCGLLPGWRPTLPSCTTANSSVSSLYTRQRHTRLSVLVTGREYINRQATHRLVGLDLHGGTITTSLAFIGQTAATILGTSATDCTKGWPIFKNFSQ